ncbi:DUF952 domain-containing protein [Aquibaculum arenosum]|uniref:DUF952 domain-containing protein n=1 Tax=Aquibaculum arenosum TaxID=3032591 RepID=A0ABT5YPJ7_9PROT|nr:DUF952 domain-containing protein [Fodinicurvata sp. CAU 1616]MDF2096802.1 DUF952 domain-containing protein [Fodinicurvata sp. CAU 1616]
MTETIYHVCRAEDWAAAGANGGYCGSADDLRDGFIHFSTAAQVRESVAKHRAGQEGLVILAVEAEALGNALRWEPSRGGQLFPHLYGPLPPEALRWERPLPLGPDGHIFPPLEA